MFVRVKKIRGNEYAYLVENIWTQKGSRQKVKAYLGRIIKPERTAENNATISNEHDFRQAVVELCKQELLNHGFSEDKEKLKHGEIIADLLNNEFTNGKKQAVIALNEGFLCSQTFGTLLDFKPKHGSLDEDIGKQLAEALLGAGLKVSHELFVALFEKACGPHNAAQEKSETCQPNHQFFK